MPRRPNPLADAGPDDEPTNEEKILSVLKDAKADTRENGDVLGLAEITKRAGTGAATSVYLSYMTRRGLVVRAARGRYRLPRAGDAPFDSAVLLPKEEDGNGGNGNGELHTSSIDDAAADDIRVAERERIAAELAKALADAVPKEAIDYIRGFQDGANYVAERVLGLTLPNVEVSD